MTIKSTYSLDVGMARALEDPARRWGVSTSEALRRAVVVRLHGNPQSGTRD